MNLYIQLLERGVLASVFGLYVSNAGEGPGEEGWWLFLMGERAMLAVVQAAAAATVSPVSIFLPFHLNAVSLCTGLN